MRIPPGLANLRERFDAVLIDLDGTLLDGAGRLTPRSVAAVRALAAAGLLPIVCTGRSVPGSRRLHRELGVDTPLVAYNGGWIGPRDGPPERYHPIDDAHLEHVEATERRASFAFRHHGESKYAAPAGHADFQRVSGWYENVVHLPGHDLLPRRDLMRVSLFFESAAEGDHAWQALPEAARGALHRETFPLAIFPDFPDSSLVLCEVQKKGRGKAAALDFLAERFGIPASRTVAVGDQMNDLAMLREAGLAVVVENAVPAAREQAHLVIGHHAAEGFAAWVEDGARFPPDGQRPRGAGAR